MRKLRQATEEDTRAIANAFVHIRQARDLLRRGGVSPELVGAVRSVLKRVDGAHRHALSARFASSKLTDSKPKE
jgi:hypothetical protein